jgi:uncharacterized repeat protein (TIGR03803 family)
MKSQTGSRKKAHSQINLRAGAVPTILAIVTLTFFTAQDIHAQQFQVLYAFTAGGDGAGPVAGITVDQAGKIYGTTTLAGANNAGTIFQQRKLSDGQWRLSILHQFQPSDGDGTTPLGRLVFGPEGLLYGTTYSGGANNCGSVYEIGPPANACANATCGWRESVIYSFGCSTTGWKPGYVDPVFDAAGNMYGTGSGGGSGYYGVVFKLAPSNGSWTESVLYSFDGSIGIQPMSSVALDSAGNIFGTTSTGFMGPSQYGTVFELSPSGSNWTETTLHSFQGPPNDGYFCISPPILNIAGNLIGGTFGGGAISAGVMYELARSGQSWTYSVIYNDFTEDGTGIDGGPTGDLVMDAQGNIYGTTFGAGAHGLGGVFKLTPGINGWTYTSLHDFTGQDDGSYPYGGVAFDAEGNMYGTASAGGLYGNGVVWEITP